MSADLILQFNRSPSHALTVCTPRIRLSVEVNSPSGKGHVIADELQLRKIINEQNTITIEIEQRQGDTTQAQRYLDASQWWLHRMPFSVEQLPAKLIAHKYRGSLVRVGWWNVTSLEVSKDKESGPLTLESLGPLPVNLRELRLRGIQVSDFKPLRDLEILSVRACPDVHDISLLEGCQHLRKVHLSGTGVENLSALAGAPVLEEITAVRSRVTIMTGLSTCPNLKKVNVAGCRSLRDLTALENTATLEEVDCSYTSVATLAPLTKCRNLRKVSFAQCHSISDISPLTDMVMLEEVDCSNTDVATLAPLATCRNLRKVCFAHCRSISDISPFADMVALEQFNCDDTCVASLAPLAHCRKLKKVDCSSCVTLHDLSALGDSPCLEVADASNSAVTTVTGLQTCPQLTKVFFNGCRSLQDLSPLAGAPSLEEVQALMSGVVTISGLGTCAKLERVFFVDCALLHDLTPLAGAPALKEVWASESGVATIAGLGTCANLKTVNFDKCASLRDLSALAGAPSLQEVWASGSGVTTITGLGTCVNLKTVLFNACRSLRDLSALAGAPSLEEVWASGSGATTITGLGTCVNLKRVDFEECASLRDLSALAGASSLEEVWASGSGVTTITGLGTCVKLKTVLFNACRSLHDLTPLAGAPSLEKIVARGSGVTTIIGLGTCTHLKTVDFDNCASLCDLSGLADAPCLEEIRASQSGVATITGLSSCPRLRHVNFIGCRMLQDVSPLESAPCLEKVECDWGGITTGRALRTRTDTTWGSQENRDYTDYREASNDDMHTDSDKSDSDAPEVGPLYTDPTALKFEIDKDGPIVALTPTVLRCNAPQDGTVYVPVPIGTTEVEPFSVSVRFTGISMGYVGCGFFKKEALDAGDATDYLMGKTQHSIGCLLEGGEVFVFIDDKPVFCGDTPKNDELTMHFSFDRKKGMIVRIEKGNVNCDEFKDMSLFAGDLYFGISMSEEGQLARILPSGIGAPRFHYGMNSMDVDEDTQMNCKHSVRASLSAHERWYGNADKCFIMRITNACRAPIGIGLVSAKLWNNGRKNMVGGKEFGPHSIGLILKDRRIYVHFQDEFIQWKPIGRMPPLPKNVDLMMRVRGGKVFFFYQGIPVNLPVIADLTLPADEQFRAAYTMSDKGQTAVIPPNLPVGAPDNVKQRCSLLGDTAHVELAEDSRVAKAIFADALCFSSEAFAITPCAWNSYPRGCSGCERTATSEAPLRGTLWLCSKCGSPDEFALCDACYWNENASKHDHDRNTFIPLFGAGHNEMRLTVEDAKDSYLEVGVAPASYKDGLGTFAKHTTVLLGKVSDLVKAAMPAEKIVAACPELKNGDDICLRVDGANMAVLVNDKAVFQTTLSVEDDPFMKQPLRFGVRMGCADQKMRVKPSC